MANAQGIDISHHQTSTPDLTNIDFVIAKASQGTWVDSMYFIHRANTIAAGKLFGAYAFNQPGVSIDDQVNTFIRTADVADFYALDVETEEITGKRFTKTQATAFMTRFQKWTGKKIGLYLSESIYFGDIGQDWDWIAHWGVSHPSVPWDIHQYRGSPLDLDQFNGTVDQMRSFFNVGETKMGFKQINIPTGTWLYVNIDLSANSGNKNIDPGRSMLLVQENTSTNTHQVMYDSNHQFYYVRKSDVTLTPLITAADCPQCPPCPDCPPPTADDCKVFSDAAFEEGYTEGHTAGYTDGKTDGYAEGYDKGKTDGTSEGITTGVEQEQTRMRNLLGL